MVILFFYVAIWFWGIIVEKSPKLVPAIASFIPEFVEKLKKFYLLSSCSLLVFSYLNLWQSIEPRAFSSYIVNLS